ncbi:MAG TPA: metal-dependent hydrolase [Pyrinomonadaceae bacterium]|nr:metal-dependent hydrolase [Pyrinomonadaceae bacterium]
MLSYTVCPRVLTALEPWAEISQRLRRFKTKPLTKYLCRIVRHKFSTVHKVLCIVSSHVPLPVAHGLIGASVVAALRDPAQMPGWKWLAFGAFLAIAPDFDFALNWLRISWGGWHHGFTHSIPFAVVVGLVTIVVLRQWKVRSFLVFGGAYVSHTLLDYMLTESR